MLQFNSGNYWVHLNVQPQRDYIVKIYSSQTIVDRMLDETWRLFVVLLLPALPHGSRLIKMNYECEPSVCLLVSTGCSPFGQLFALKITLQTKIGYSLLKRPTSQYCCPQSLIIRLASVRAFHTAIRQDEW